jgi:CheY-like chemotaxis protein
MSGDGSKTLGGLHILVVDDDAAIRSGLADVLQLLGADVTAVGRARLGLVAVEARRPDLLVADIVLPDDDGYSLLKDVRALGAERGGALPAIAISGYTGEEVARGALSQGFEVHLTKPFDVDELVAHIKRLTKRDEGQRRGDPR